MDRRTSARGRVLVAVGGILALVGCFLPWYTLGGDAVTPLSRNAFEGAGILVFIAAILVLALILLPYAAGDRNALPVDRGASFVLVAAIGVVGLLLRIVQVQAQRQERTFGLFMPDRALGLWVAGLGLALIVWGTIEIVVRRPAR